MMVRKLRSVGIPRYVYALALGALVALTGCSSGGSGSGGSSSGATTTPSAQQILQRAQHAKLTDATVRVIVAGSLNKRFSVIEGTGTLTTQPARVACTCSLTVADTTSNFEEIDDLATQATYVKMTSPPQQASTQWRKTSSPIAFLDLPQMLAYAQLTDAYLVGAEQENGVSVWHVRGSLLVNGNADLTDVYLRQDTYLPVILEVSITGDSFFSVRYEYTAVNTGATITLPPADQIQNG